MAFSLSSLSKKHIPTILGLIVLLTGLVGGVFLVRSTNTNSFLPRASPQTTPKNLKITNVTDTSYTVSWVTDSATVGYVKYGTNATTLTTTVNDDRDQSSGSTGLFKTHHATVRALRPKTAYYFKIGTGTQELYDNNGSAYTVTTVSSISSQARTVYGDIVLPAGTAAAGALVYVSADNMAPMSAIVQTSGSWVLSLSQARSKDLQSAAVLAPETSLSLLVLSPSDSTTSIVTVPIKNAQPVPQITVGTNQDFSVTQTPVTPAPIGVGPSPTPASETEQSKFTSMLLAPPTEVAVTNGLTITYPAVDGDLITVNLPQLQGAAPAASRVTVSVKGKSTQTSTVTTDPSGIWTFTPLSKLTNGAYTLTISATIEGVKKTATRTFTVDLTQAGNVPSFTASSSGTVASAPTPTVAAVATITPIPKVSHPSTESGVPATGGVTPTLFLVVMGICMLLIGTGMWIVL